LVVLATAPARAQDSSTVLLAAARAHLAARHMDSAAALYRRVAEAPGWPANDRVQAWVMLGVVDYYRSGDSATADAFRHALELDSAFEVKSLAQFEPAIADILTAQRAKMFVAPAAPAAPARTVSPSSQELPVYDCLNKCPASVFPPQFEFFPRIEVTDASVGVYDRRSRTFLQFEAVVSPQGVLEPESVVVSGGTARGAESEIRRALLQARFHPGRFDAVPVRARVRLRFDFEAEGTAWVKYSYRVTAR
jgi:hypothetical protein